MQIIDGKKIAERVLGNIKEQVSSITPKPTLAIIYAGENPASEIYVSKKFEAAKQAGIETELIRLPETTTKELLEVTTSLNKRDEITGYIVQLPLPKEIDRNKVLSNISLEKDVDGLNPISLGNLWHGNPCLVSATALAVMECIKFVMKYDDNEYEATEMKNENEQLENFLKAKNILIINDTLLVGKPLSAILLKNGATVTIANEYTDSRELKKFIARSKIIVTATGQAGLIDKDMIRDGQLLIDVGINKSALGVGGDINPEGLDNKKIWYTPVPNGVGPITVAMLLQNILKAYKN